MPATALLNRLLEPVGSAIGPEGAKQLLGIRADAETQRRVDELADRANEGTITPEERSEYEALIATATVIGILQARARVVLSEQSRD